MKKVISFILPVIMLFTMTACGGKNEGTAPAETTSAAAAASDTAVSEESAPEVEGGFKVSGTKLLDANGNEFIFRGVNHAHAWFAQNDGEALDAIAATGANSVRIVLANGIQWQSDTAETVEKLIDMCKQRKLIAVLEVHDGTGDDSIETLEKIGEFWIGVKDALAGNEAYAILNIANEWVGKWDSKIWRDGYVSVIPKLREAGIKNTIMVDSAGWGQYAKAVGDYGKEVFESDPDRNTMFSVHMYGSAGKNEKTITDNITYATSQDLCICVGEFGYNHSDGDVNEAFIMDYCCDNGIGYLAWSWKGNGGGVEYLDIAVRWDGSELSSDWGEPLINGENGIKATSKLCSVYE
ncbi:MAG: cellulase family glycosylhydrolase [Oscillospiraceae bacterium]|nr:cellulase family glycosylhydrolase [Oscillospiraceae bacterium]